VPGRIVITDVEGSGEPRIVVGGDILTDVSTCRILTPEGKMVAQMAVEGWTSMLTALAFGEAGGRRLLSCGASRGNNLHLFEFEEGQWQRRWLKQLGGQINGISIFGTEDRMIVATSQGFLIGYDLSGKQLWHLLMTQGLRHMVQIGPRVIAVDGAGVVRIVNLAGQVEAQATLPGPCSHIAAAADNVYFACGSEIWHYSQT